MRLLKRILFVIAVLVIMYVLGPHPSSPVYNKAMPAVPATDALLETYISQQEAQHKTKPGNAARIVWATA